ncbi:Fur family transcriptional regulator [Alkalibacterium sp. 20]|uniref:Fur family transcriptional regulator n=1 Tax=Alkalibacterium sp. 20 TaxID=1798803 RepID=UPI000900437B|nr:Fur family transcriptional regulator [Alkalibacterium sp. 20]OJF90946.1 Fur family transcriptional regulator [Alkalibacterium sp. 20]
MAAFEQAVRTLKQNGYKTTGKRQRILEVLYKTNKYMSAKEVQDRLKKTFPGISPDTIYRNLHMFVELNVVEETELNGEKLFRAMCDVHGHHHHFICTECGKTKELECPLELFQDQLPGYEVESHRFELFGKCEACLKKTI